MARSASESLRGIHTQFSQKLGLSRFHMSQGRLVLSGKREGFHQQDMPALVEPVGIDADTCKLGGCRVVAARNRAQCTASRRGLHLVANPFTLDEQPG